MSLIRSQDTTPELAVRKTLTAMGHRYRLHYKPLPGQPDIAFPGKKKAIWGARVLLAQAWRMHTCTYAEIANRILEVKA